MSPGLRRALGAVDRKHRGEPDLPARDRRFEDEEEAEAEIHGDAAGTDRFGGEDLDEI